MAIKDKDGLDKVIAFLQKREGIDKTLKLLRYTSRLVAAVSPKDSEAYKRFSAFEKSVGVSRKAFRLGKFLQDYNNLRKSRATGLVALLELVAYSGEGVYFFIEQFVWLIKAGALDKDNEPELSTMSAWSEMIGYVANIWISIIKLRAIQAEDNAVRLKLQKEGAAPRDTTSTCGSVHQLRTQLAVLMAARQLRILAIVQDLADSTLALNDIRGGRDRLLGHPVTLALAGLVSGCISAHKNWKS